LFDEITARESPVLAIQTLSSITSITIAQEPLLSFTCIRFYRMNISSASLNPFIKAYSGLFGNDG
jgi:hypothetical protein